MITSCKECQYFKESKCTDETTWINPEDQEECCRYLTGAINISDKVDFSHIPVVMFGIAL